MVVWWQKHLLTILSQTLTDLEQGAQGEELPETPQSGNEVCVCVCVCVRACVCACACVRTCV